MKSRFYVTTPIYYVNADPHIGHAYTSFAADVLARYHRLRGDEVFFLTGTDENSQKDVEAAEKRKMPVKKYVDEMSARWRTIFDSLGITNDDFIRTTEPRHRKGVEKFINAVQRSGDIYPGTYQGYYCVGCEAFVGEVDTVDGKCPIHQIKLKKIKEKNYFFKLTKYRKKLLDHINKYPEFIQPETRKNEVIRYITDFMEDVSITRQSQKWGIPFPGDEKQALYVWFDALVNYLTGIGYGLDAKKFKKFWPADVHLVGKDIIKFHCALWPAMLMSAGLELPKRVFAHGYFTVNGEKISKSLGNTIDPLAASQKFGIDALRYYLLREIPFGGDGDYSETRLVERYNSDLANGIGNLASRILSMAEKYADGEVPKPVSGSAAPTWQSYELKMKELSLDGALSDIWDLIRTLDGFIDREQPWVLAKTNPKHLQATLYTLLESLRHVGLLLWPFMPETAEKILDSLGVLESSRQNNYDKNKSWGTLKAETKIRKTAPLFPRRDI